MKPLPVRFLMRLSQWPQKALIGLVRFYRFFLSPWLGSGCRFEPTCSAYALQALQRHGAMAGVVLTGRRLLRCHPWCAGGHDPVPDVAGSRFFTRLLVRDRRAAGTDPLSPTSTSS